MLRNDLNDFRSRQTTQAIDASSVDSTKIATIQNLSIQNASLQNELPHRSSNTARSMRATHWLSLAVTVAIAFVLGMMMPSLLDPSPSTVSQIVHTKPLIEAPNTPTMDSQSSETPLVSSMPGGMQLQMVDQKGEYPTQSVNLPLVKINRWDSSVMKAAREMERRTTDPKRMDRRSRVQRSRNQKGIAADAGATDRRNASDRAGQSHAISTSRKSKLAITKYRMMNADCGMKH